MSTILLISACGSTSPTKEESSTVSSTEETANETTVPSEKEESLIISSMEETTDEPDGSDTVYTYRGESITRAEYMALREKMLHIPAPEEE